MTGFIPPLATRITSNECLRISIFRVFNAIILDFETFFWKNFGFLIVVVVGVYFVC